MKKLLTILLLFLASGLLYAQVSLEDCRDMARKNHPAIRMYGIIDATKAYSISNVSTQWLPTIHLGALAGLYNNVSKIDDLFSEVTDQETHRYYVDELLHGQMNVLDPSPWTYKISAELSQNIYDGGASRTSKKYSEAEALLQMAETDVTLEQVCDRVDEVFFSIILLEKRILQTESRIKVLQTARKRIASLLDAGSTKQDELDMLDAASIIAEQQKEDLGSSLKSFRMVLSLLTGSDLSSVGLTVPPSPLQPREDPQALTLERRMTLLALEKDKLDVALKPRLDFVADAYYGYPNRNIFSDLVSHSPKLNAFLGLRLSWSPTALYTRKNDLAILANSREKIKIQKDILDMDIRLQNSSANLEMERLRKSIERDNELVSLRERLRKSAETAFSQGEINTDDLLSKIDEEYQAKLNAEIHEIESLRESYKLRR